MNFHKYLDGGTRPRRRRLSSVIRKMYRYKRVHSKIVATLLSTTLTLQSSLVQHLIWYGDPSIKLHHTTPPASLVFISVPAKSEYLTLLSNRSVYGRDVIVCMYHTVAWKSSYCANGIDRARESRACPVATFTAPAPAARHSDTISTSTRRIEISLRP